ncbi:MAG: YidC/Oxa1 family membrane protein insertase [Solirubrobacterales bacterium]|nr:YidC/Oxa1 family membrane protein insertase [Solirubrobacterales bacterium]
MPFITAGIQDIFETILSPLIAVFQAIMLFFHDTIGIGWGMAIIALTVVVRIVLLPLTIKQFRSMQALQTLSPQIKALQAKYKGDKQRLNQEMMKFYQENKVNPFGSCLPLVAQIPVFISLFYMLRKPLKIDICGPESAILAVGNAATPPTGIDTTYCQAVDPGSAKFLFIPDLTAPSVGWVLILLLVLYVGSQLLSSLLMSVTSDRNQKIIMIALPFVFVFFIKGFPAGLMVYWITTNFWTVGQQYFLKRATGQLPPWLGGNPDGLPTTVAVAGAGASGGSGDGSSTALPPAAKKKKKRSGKRS